MMLICTIVLDFVWFCDSSYFTWHPCSRVIVFLDKGTPSPGCPTLIGLSLIYVCLSTGSNRTSLRAGEGLGLVIGRVFLFSAIFQLFECFVDRLFPSQLPRDTLVA